MATSTNSIGRRTFLRSAAAAATLSAVGLGVPAAAGASAPNLRGSWRSTPAPETVDLPAGLRPEGITSGPGTRYYVGSLADGRIVAGDLLAGTAGVLLPGAAGRQLRGLMWDGRSNLVWAAGNVGAEAHVYAVDGTSGAIVSDTVVPGASFLNDLVVTADAVWVTDSRVDRLTMLALGPGGTPLGAVPAHVPLGGAWPAGDGAAINANGIRELPDGSLVLNNSRVGGLWQVDKASGTAAAIPVRGGPGITAGDGLELAGHTLYNVRGSGPAEVSVLLLSAEGTSWAAKWVGARSDETLDVPSTATLAGGWLWAVNARFGVPSPGTAEYWITRLPARR